MLVRFCLIFFTAFFLEAASIAGAEMGKGQWLLITAPAFREALSPLIEHRRAEGLAVQVIATTNVLTGDQIEQGEAVPLQRYVQQWSRASNGPNYLLLAGVMTTDDPALRLPTVVPAMLGTIERMKGQPTDHSFGLPTQDGAPLVAVGRFPARTTDEITVMMQKTLRLERDRAPGEWRRRLLLLGGNPGGGPVAELMIDSTLAPRLEQLHPSWNVRGIVSVDASRYYLSGAQARETFLRHLDEGAFLTLFVGHSRASAMWLSGEDFVTRDDWTRAKMVRGLGILLTCGCYACQIQGPEGEGYALAAMRHRGGPGAVIGAGGETYAAAGLLAVDGLLKCLQKPPFPSRLGEYWLSVQRGLARGPIPTILFNLYDRFDGSKGKVPLPVQRLEHLEMWILLGDPALRFPPVAEEIVLEPIGPVEAGQNFRLNGILPERLKGARVHVTLERSLGSRANMEKLPADSPVNRPERERVTLQNHERTHNYVLAGAEAKTDGLNFSSVMTVPAEVTWPHLVIRAVAASNDESALGILRLSVRPRTIPSEP